MVFYLKYRPQTINELDNESVRSALYSVLTLPDVPHAFLFTGPKGLGKTSAARILAKAVNCEREVKSKKQKANRANVQRLMTNDQPEPCNECEQCISITGGTNLDILEIDAASNRGIDEIRDLREKIRLSPAASKRKVYIIDEVHMLTTEAFNALLKTLEEPPTHAMFILCTTELNKVPDTIISRCFHIQFTPASIQDIKRAFKRISEKEGLKVTDEAIEQITSVAGGGFRDAVKILEELVAMGEEKISIELVEKRYKVVSSKYQVVSMIESLEKQDVKAGLEIVREIVEQGMDIKLFTQQLAETIHELLLIKAGIQMDSRSKVQESRMETYELRELLVLLNKVLQDMKYSVLPQLPLELAIIDWDGLNLSEVEGEGVRLRSASGRRDRGGENQRSKIKDQNENQQTSEQATNETIAPVSANKTGTTVAEMRKQVGEMARVKALYGESEEATNPKPILKVTDFSLLNISNTEITKEWIDGFWRVYISEIKQYNHTIAGVLRSCRIAKFDKENFIIETAYEFHRDRLNEGKTREVLENVCKTLTGSVLRVEVILRGA